MLGVSQSRGLKLFGHEIIFKEFQVPTYVIMIPDRHGRTDRQTDGRLTVASPRSALESRGKNCWGIAILEEMCINNRWWSCSTKCDIFRGQSPLAPYERPKKIDFGWVKLRSYFSLFIDQSSPNFVDVYEIDRRLQRRFLIDDIVLVRRYWQYSGKVVRNSAKNVLNWIYVFCLIGLVFLCDLFFAMICCIIIF